MDFSTVEVALSMRFLSALGRLFALAVDRGGSHASIAVAATVGLLLLNILVILLRSGQASPVLIAGVVSLEAPQELPSADAADADIDLTLTSPTPTANVQATAIPAPTTAATATAEATSTATATATATPLPTVAPLVLAAAVPSEGGIAFVSASAPYSIAYPASWAVQAQMRVGNLASDVFRQVTSRSRVRSVITVAAEERPRDLTAEQALRLHIASNLSGKTVRPLGRYQAAGFPALLISFSDTDAGEKVTAVQAVFTTPGKSWTFGLLAAPENALRDTGTLLWMLDQFMLRR